MIIPKAQNAVVHLLTDATEGATDHPEIDLKHYPASVLSDKLTSLVGKEGGPNNVPPPVPGLIDLWGEAKTIKREKASALRSIQSNGRALAQTCVNTLRPALGAHWNSEWNQVGFVNGSLKIPDDPSPVLLGLRAFYGKNPAREVPSLNGTACTAAACQAAADAITKADTESRESNTALGEAHMNLQNGLLEAREMLSGLQSELGQLVADDDPRWLAFGFDLPGHHASPEVPQHLVVTPGAAGSLFTHCDDTRRAESYRFKVLDAATGAVLAELLVHESQVTFEHLTSGTNVKVIASAYNSTGESQACEPVTAVVP